MREEEGKKYNFGDFGHTISPLAQIDFESMLRKKQAKARDAMKRYNLGAVLCLTDQNVEYATNIPMWGGASTIGGSRYAIFPYEGTPIVFEECDSVYHLKRQFPNLRIEYAIPTAGGPYRTSHPEGQKYLMTMFADLIYDVLRELKLDKERIGVDANEPIIISALEKKGLIITLEGAKALIDARHIKTSEELDLMRMSANIMDGAFGVLARTARPGVTERDVFAECVSYGIKAGLNPDGGYITSGPHTWPKDLTRAFSDRKLEVGDVVVCDLYNFGCFGYRNCYYRSFSIGPASSEVRAAYKEMVTLLKEAESILRPGITTKDVVEKWPDEIKLWSKRPPYITDERSLLSTFFNNMGHGLGLSLYEPPFFWRPLSLRWPQELEAGMVFALETQAGTRDNSQGVRAEDIIIITEDGYEVITKWPVDEIAELPLW